jgi:hypothetical protein
MFFFCPAMKFFVDKNSIKNGVHTNIVPRKKCEGYENDASGQALSLLASFYVRTFFVDTLLWAKLAKISENRNSSGSTPAEKFSAVTRLVVTISHFKEAPLPK